MAGSTAVGIGAFQVAFILATRLRPAAVASVADITARFLLGPFTGPSLLLHSKLLNFFNMEALIVGGSSGLVERIQSYLSLKVR